MVLFFDRAGHPWLARAFAPRVHASHLDDMALADYAVRNLGCVTLSMHGQTPLLGYRAGYVSWDSACAALAAALTSNVEKIALSEWRNAGVVVWLPRAHAIELLLSAAEMRPATPSSLVIGETLDATDEALIRVIGDEFDYPLVDGLHVYKRSSFGVTVDGEVYLETVGQGFEIASRRALERMRGKALAHWEDPAYGRLLGRIVARAVDTGRPIVTMSTQRVVVAGVPDGLRVYRRIAHYQGFRRGRHEVRVLTATVAEMVG